MAKLINLRMARKAKARANKRAQADENTVKFGLTKGQRAVVKQQNDTARRHLDNTRRDPPKPDKP